jgi:hypothetical protein
MLIGDFFCITVGVLYNLILIFGTALRMAFSMFPGVRPTSLLKFRNNFTAS